VAQNITIFFGEMGCGKSYCASRYAEKHGFPFFEGDDVATPDLVARASKFKPLTREIITKYVRVLGDAIIGVANYTEAPTLIVSQALYSEEDRCFLMGYLQEHGFNVRFWLVRCAWHRNVRNLLTRPKGLRWVYYWLINKPFFQKPVYIKYSEYPNVFK
jgi:gluconate kinase